MSTSTNTTNTTQTPLAQIHPSSSSNSGSGGEFMLLPCGGRTKSTRDILALLRQQVQGFPQTSFIADNTSMALLKPLLQEAANAKRHAESSGKRIKWKDTGKEYGTAMAAHNTRLQDNQGLLFLSPMPSQECIRKFRYKLDGDKPVKLHKEAQYLEIVTVEQFVDYSKQWQGSRQADMGNEGACQCHEFCNYIIANTTFGPEFLDLCFEKCRACESSEPKAKRSKRSGNPTDESASSLEQGTPTTSNGAENTVEATEPTVNQTSNTIEATHSTVNPTSNTIEATRSTVNQTANTTNTTRNMNSNNTTNIFNTTHVYLSCPSSTLDAQLALFENRKLKQYIVDHGLPVPDITIQQFLDERAREATNSSSDVASPSGSNRNP